MTQDRYSRPQWRRHLGSTLAEQSIVGMPAALLDRAAMLTQGLEVDIAPEIEGNVTP